MQCHQSTCRVIRITATLVACVASTGAARADVVASNLGTFFDLFYEQVAEHTGLPGGHRGEDLAFPFTAGDSARLDSVSIRFRLEFGSTYGTGFHVAIAADAAGVPGAVLGTLSGEPSPAPGSGVDTYPYTSVGQILLSPGSTYWILMSVPHGSAAPSSNFQLWLTEDSSQTSRPGWSIGYTYARQEYVNGSVSLPWSGYAGASGLMAIEATLLSSPCYANCDQSTAVPVLNVNDFICFQAKFAAGDTYANCDGSTQPPVLNVNDFVCFQGRFAAGCR
jgi:hypothetical protein